MKAKDDKNVISEELKRKLITPTQSFKKHVAIAMVGLLSFILVYLGLMIWFGVLAYNSFVALRIGVENAFFVFITFVGLAFLSLFMFKSLFIFNKKKEELTGRITEDDEPELFQFIYAIADEVGAPRPYKVFLSTRVNACVFYDLSIINLLFPTKKNLEIGLGLINVLNVGELKAVLAHEFGHFAQKSMLLGRYVYTAQQIAVRVVNKRDILDQFLAGLSSVDIRIAWVGWILSIMVWAVRALIQTLFSVVVIAERALSREMEFQADLVAVSVTGSDALVHGLHKLKAADEGYHASIEAINTQLKEKKAVEDLFSLQTNFIKKMQWILANPLYGASPEIKGEKARVFSKRGIAPPEMWATHPADNEREENAKKIYVSHPIDPRSSWELFKDPQSIRKNETAQLIRTANLETSILAEEESIECMNAFDYNWSFLNPVYKGNFLFRSSFIAFESIDEFYAYKVDSNIVEELNMLYPDSLKLNLESHKEVREELAALKNVLNESLTMEKRKIMHRGRAIKKRNIPQIIKELEKEELGLRNLLVTHDVKCRSVSYITANILNPKVGEYLKHLGGLVHYSEHTLANLNDMMGKFSNVLHTVLADGRVSSSEMTQLLKASNELHSILESIYEDRSTISVGACIQERIGKTYAELHEAFKLEKANKHNIQDWVNVVEGWVVSALDVLNKLRNAALEELLNKEEEVKKCYLSDCSFEIETASISLPSDYERLTPGQERTIAHQLNFWNRFHLGDGLIPSIAKFAVSLLLIGGALYVGNISQEVTLHLYNGLNRGVTVSINGEVYEVASNDHHEINVNYSDKFHVLTQTLLGDTIESFYKKMDTPSGHYIYNIANSAYFVEYSVSYGFEIDLPNRNLGVSRWFSTEADYVLEEAPQSISGSSNSSGVVKEVLTVYPNANPYYLYELDQAIKIEEMVLSHAIWDLDTSAYILYWGSLASSIDTTLSFISERLKRNPYEVYSYRLLQDYSNNREKVCNECRTFSEADSNNPDLYYLSTRCIAKESTKDSMFIAGYKKWSDHGWLAYASGYVFASQENWEKAYECYDKVIVKMPQISNSIAPDFERITRMVKDSDHILGRYNDWLNYYYSLERGNDEVLMDNVDELFYHLSQGNVTDAIKVSEYFDLKEMMYSNWFIAASDNCPKEFIDKVLNYPIEESVNSNNMWTVFALIAKENLNLSEYLDFVKTKFPETRVDFDNLEKFIKNVKKGKLNLANQLLNKVTSFEEKRGYELIATILLKDKTPLKWRTVVEKAIFITEKPYLKMKH
ncbi:MAG: M48 family metallopeptidase [Flavobacteriales bacterium]|jgi:Zn-dependent protease with chaperone function|nr:M48 family metallopeptidase [Flavobacteriales bacterium]